MKRTIYLWKLVCFLSLLIGVTWHANAQISLIQGINCPGDSIGELGVVSPSFGTGPYTYLWNNGKTTQSISGLKAGTYSVTVTDNLAVAQNFSYVLANAPAIVTSPAIVDNSTWPANTGQITMNGTGGTGWLGYELRDSINYRSTLSPDGVFASLPSGTYYITTMDMNQCTRKDTIRVKENAGIVVNLDIDYTACYASSAPITVRPISNAVPIKVDFGDTSMTIIARVAGPRPYVLSNLDTVDAVGYDALPGFHVVVVSDAVTRGFRHSWMVDSTSAPITLDWTLRNISCHAGNNGQLNMTARGSYENYMYQTTGPNSFSSNNQNLNNLVAGRYRVHVEDANNKDNSHCALDQTITLTEPDKPVQVVIEKKDNTCYLSNDAVATARASGGIGQLHYSWAPGGQTTYEIKNMTAGSYTVSVRDTNNCTANASVVISQPARLQPSSTVIVPLTCYGYNNASISVVPSGGNKKYEFAWKNNGVVMPYTNNSISNLVASTYSLHIRDSLNCGFDSTWVITQPTKIAFELVNTPISCNDELATIRIHNMDIINLTGNLGTLSSVVAPDDTIGFNNLKQGSYVVNISNGTCQIDTSVSFSQPLPLTLYVQAEANKCFAGREGSLDMEIRGGSSGPYSTCTISSSDTTMTFTTPNRNFSINNLLSNTYTIRVVDEGNCQVQQTALITGPDRPIYVVFDEPITPRCRFTADGIIKIRRIDGAEAPITYMWSDGQTNKDADSLRAGKYTVAIVDANGCTTQDSLVLKPGNRCMYNIVTPNGDGYNDYLDLTDLCKDFQMKAIVVDQYGKTVKQLSENNPRWDPNDLGYLPTGTSSTFTVFFELTQNGQLYGKDGISFSVIFEKK